MPSNKIITGDLSLRPIVTGRASIRPVITASRVSMRPVVTGKVGAGPPIEGVIPVSFAGIAIGEGIAAGAWDTLRRFRGTAVGEGIAAGAWAVVSGLPDGNADFIAALDGDASVPVFYDVREGVTVPSGVSQWDDCRGASGFGPSLAQATVANRPAFSGTDDSNYLITFDGVNDYLQTALSALFNATTAKTLIMFANSLNGSGGHYHIALTNSANDKWVTFQQTDNPGPKLRTYSWNGATASVAQSTIAPSSTRRTVIGEHRPGLANTIQVPAEAIVSAGGANGAFTSENYRLTMGVFGDGTTGLTNMAIRALVLKEGTVDATQRAAIKTYGETYHAAVAA